MEYIAAFYLLYLENSVLLGLALWYVLNEISNYLKKLKSKPLP